MKNETFCIIYSNLRTNIVPLKTGTGFLAIQSKISLYSLAKIYIYQIRSDQSLSHVRLFATPWITARQASLSITNSRSSLRLTFIKSVMPSHPLSSPSLPAPNHSQHQSLLQWVNSSHEVAKVLEFSKEHPGLISFRMNWLDLLTIGQ